MTQEKSPAGRPGLKGSTHHFGAHALPLSSPEAASSQARADAARLLDLNQCAIAKTPNAELIARLREAARITEGRIEFARRRLDDLDATIARLQGRRR